MQKEADIFFGHFAVFFIARRSIVGQKFYSGTIFSFDCTWYISVPLFLIVAIVLQFDRWEINTSTNVKHAHNKTFSVTRVVILSHFLAELETIFVTFCHKRFVENMHLLFLKRHTQQSPFYLKKCFKQIYDTKSQLEAILF